MPGSVEQLLHRVLGDLLNPGLAAPLLGLGVAERLSALVDAVGGQGICDQAADTQDDAERDQ